MPDLIDPRWEYWEPDPEIAWLFAQSAGGERTFAAVGLEDNRVRDHGGNVGFRFGSGEWLDGGSFRLKPARPERPVAARRKCQGCGQSFDSDNPSSNRVYCSGCPHKPVGWVRSLADRSCKACGTSFRPKRAAQMFCSRICGGAASKGRPPRLDWDAVCRSYDAGESSYAIAIRLDITRSHVCNLLKRCGRTLGKPGRRKQDRRTG